MNSGILKLGRCMEKYALTVEVQRVGIGSGVPVGEGATDIPKQIVSLQCTRKEFGHALQREIAS